MHDIYGVWPGDNCLGDGLQYRIRRPERMVIIFAPICEGELKPD
jgi:hypothetical protein